MSNPITFDSENKETWPVDDSLSWFENGNGTHILLHFDHSDPHMLNSIGFATDAEPFTGHTYYPCDQDGIIDAGVFDPPCKGKYLTWTENCTGKLSIGIDYYDGYWPTSGIHEWMFLPETN